MYDPEMLDNLADSGRSMVALDLGTQRTGVALADPPKWIALPLTTLHAVDFARLFTLLVPLLEERNCGALVLGLPLLADGSKGDQALWAEKFQRYFAWRNATPCFWQDERYTSEAVADGARTLGLRAASRHNGKDAGEASLILADFLATLGIR